MGYLLQVCFVVLFEMLCCKIFFDTFLRENSNTKRKQFCCLAILVVLFILFVVILDKHFILKEIMIVLSVTVCMKVYTGKSFRKNFVLAIIYQGILLITDFITILLEQIFLKNVDLTQGMSGVLVLTLDKAALFLIVVLVKYIFGEKEFTILQDTDWLRFLFFPLFTICVITALISNESGGLGKQEGQLFIVIAVGLVGMNIVLFYLLNDIVRREKRLRENRMFEVETRNQLQLYETLSESVEQQRQLSHEYHNQLGVIQELCKNEDMDSLQKYLAEINGEVQHDMDCIDTHHAIVNAVVNKKYHEATDKGILFICKINDMMKLDMSNQDIVLLLSNLLNNAIEACERVADEKVIKFKFVLEDNKLIISVKNTYNPETIHKSNDEFQTSKTQDVESHGFGLKNVIKVVQKNQGDYIIETKDKEFFISIIIPQKRIS